jgi:hypothetical protein
MQKQERLSHTAGRGFAQELEWFGGSPGCRGGVPVCDEQWSLAIGSYPGAQCHSCCGRMCVVVTISTPS